MTDNSIVISVIAIVIAFISLIWNIITKIMNDRHIVFYTVSLGRVYGGSITEKVITVNVTNASKFTKYVGIPMLLLYAEKRKHSKLLYVKFAYGPVEQSYIELAPGKSTSFNALVSTSLIEHFEDVEKNNTLRFKVQDALKHRYYTNPMKMQEVLDFYNKV